MEMLNKFEEVFFYLLLFSIPFQRRIILWQQNWYFNEWQSISVYATDLLLVSLFVFWLFNNRPLFKFLVLNKPINLKNSKSDLFLILFLIIAGISIKNGESFVFGFFSWLKLVEFVLFYFYLKKYAIDRFSLSYSFLAIFAGGLFQALIAVGQFLKQSSLDLGLQIFGEGFLRPEVNGVAVFLNNSGQKIMRAYGTTPHPNILAGYLFLAIFSFYAWYWYNKIQLSRNIELSLLAVYGVIVFALMTTFSRTVMFVFVLGMVLRFGLNLFQGRIRKKFIHSEHLKIKMTNIATTTLIVMGIFTVVFWPEVKSRALLSLHDEAVVLRIYYNKEALGTSINWFGVGLGNFVNWFMVNDPYRPKWFYQPVHNIYLLVYSETGLAGIAAFGLFLILLIKEFIQKTKLKGMPEYSILLMVLSFLFIGIFDHYLITLQQGKFIFWLTLAMLNISYIEKIQKEIGGRN